MIRRINLATLAMLAASMSIMAAQEREASEPEAFQVIRKRDTRQLAAMLDSNAADVIKVRGAGDASLLHLAAAQDDTEALQLLIARGAIVDAQAENGATPLHWAANCNAASAVRMLLDNGANINARTTRDFVPLHWAALGNATNAIAVLLERGAESILRNDEGKTPLDLATERRADQSAAVLRNAQSAPQPKTTPAMAAPGARADKRHWWAFWRKQPPTPTERPPVSRPAKSPAPTVGQAADELPKTGQPATRVKTTPAMAAPGARADKQHWWTFWRKQPPTPTERPPVSRPAKSPAPTAGQAADELPKTEQPAPPVALPPVRVAPPPPRVAKVVSSVKDAPPGTQVQIVTFNDGSAYEGGLLRDKFHGFGTLMSASGDMYRGNWVNGERHGSGEYAFADGERYKGEWAKGRMWGKGAYVFANGDRIEGTWQNNALLKGEGSFRFSNGDRYTGEWLRDRPWGKGTYMAADGRTFIGYFVSGRFVGPKHPSEDPTMVSDPEPKAPANP